MDLTSPEVIKKIRAKFDFNFKKGLGQNFLTSGDVIDKITHAADPCDGVLEIGPGFGVLTQSLAENSPKVVSVEIDERLNEVLEFTLADYDNVKIINRDILKIDLKELIKNEFGDKKISVAANLPYYITTPIITKLIEEKLNIKNIVVMVQKEVALRLSAEAGSKDYGAITLLCLYYTQPSIVTNVPASLFVPPPKVDSAVLKLDMLEEPRVKVLDEKMFFRVVKAAFSQRRKTLLNCLSSALPIPNEQLSKLMEDTGILPTRRGETLDIEEFAKLSDCICSFLQK